MLTRYLRAATALAVLLCQPQQAVRAAAPPIPGMPSDSTPRLAPGDRVLLTVHSHPELSGEVVINWAGDLPLPLGEAIRAVGLTPGALERAVTERLGDGYLVQPRVSIQPAELRPVYVLGEVRTPGPVPYREGLTVLAAIATVGGPLTAAADSVALRGELLEAEERLQFLMGQRTALRARMARLVAQRNGDAEPRFPADLDETVATRRVVEGERALFRSEAEATARQLALLNERVAAAEQQSAAYAELIRVERQQLTTVTGYAAELNRLARSGIIERRRLIEMQLEEARLTSNLARLATELARSQEPRREAPLRAAEITAGVRQRALAELQQSQERLAEIESSLATAAELVTVRQHRLGRGAQARLTDRTRLRVTRAGPDGAQLYDVQEDTVLLPSDVLRVGDLPGDAAAAAVLIPAQASSNGRERGRP